MTAKRPRPAWPSWPPAWHPEDWEDWLREQDDRVARPRDPLAEFPDLPDLILRGKSPEMDDVLLAETVDHLKRRVGTDAALLALARCIEGVARAQNDPDLKVSAEPIGRPQIIAALGAVSRLLKELRQPELVGAFYLAQTAFLSLEHGIPEPILSPNKPPRGRRVTRSFELLRAHAAAAAELLHRSRKYSYDAAYKFVAEVLDDCGHINTSAEKVADWRYQALEGKPAGLRADYNRLIAEAERQYAELGECRFENFAVCLLEQIRALALPAAPRKIPAD